ncbi:asparagine synthase-related protein [Pseudonocardia nigra]|uniref:asparagine synthase-related protein n=1 Tax=Pseudonocardia nigra TaxID=1921578 RepID=UPI001C5F3526|nr:asparagine synthase-related protein [Pseudonocardia nigra]
MTHGTAPLHLTISGENLIASWDPAELAFATRPEHLSPAVAARLLTRRHRYSTDTLFTTITRLTAGATALFHNGGLTVAYPPPAQHVVKCRKLRPGADPVRILERTLHELIVPIVSDHSGKVAVELSGGVDSANVAATTARCSAGPVMSGGLLVGGKAGREQRARREVIAEHFRLRDVAVHAWEHLPLSPDGPRTASEPHYPDGALTGTSITKHSTSFATASAKAVVTSCSPASVGMNSWR